MQKSEKGRMAVMAGALTSQGGVDGKIKLGVVGYTSEWAQFQLFEALFHIPEIREKYEIAWISGGEQNAGEARQRIWREVGEKAGDFGSTVATPLEWRAKNVRQETKNLMTLDEMLEKGKVAYVPMNRNWNELPESAYDSVDAVAIFTNNPTHHFYIADAVAHGKHVLCEKPLAPVFDNVGSPTMHAVRSLEDTAKEAERRNLIVMDAEHYSQKIATLTFFGHLPELSEKYGKITSVFGVINEIDNPEKGRTRKALSRENQTGALADTGIHILGIVAAIGGELGEVDKEADSLAMKQLAPYDVDTYVSFNGRLKPICGKESWISDGATIDFSVGKFIDRYSPEDSVKGGGGKAEEKYLSFRFTDDKGEHVYASLDFKAGEVTLQGVNIPKRWLEGKGHFHSLEYANILTEFYGCISSAKSGGVSLGLNQPRTSIRNSIAALKGVHSIYQLARAGQSSQLQDCNQFQNSSQIQVHKQMQENGIAAGKGGIAVPGVAATG
ncbi:Gfo/Idh/MocA family oxidoreductase [Candidatus Woesearchaeota archaeon]|nr:Gfo/Idh/MocA family oxidoreductase [Candidatus Woesearchaeota archaeon]